MKIAQNFRDVYFYEKLKLFRDGVKKHETFPLMLAHIFRFFK